MAFIDGLIEIIIITSVVGGFILIYYAKFSKQTFSEAFKRLFSIFKSDSDSVVTQSQSSKEDYQQQIWQSQRTRF